MHVLIVIALLVGVAFMIPFVLTDLRAVSGFDGVIFMIDDGLSASMIVAFVPGSSSG